MIALLTLSFSMYFCVFFRLEVGIEKVRKERAVSKPSTTRVISGKPGNEGGVRGEDARRCVELRGALDEDEKERDPVRLLFFPFPLSIYLFCGEVGWE